MPVRQARAEWNGSLRDGSGTMKMENAGFEGPYSFSSRFEEGEGTNPEELIAAAHAGCFSMALSAGLGKAGFTPRSIRTTASVHMEKVDGANRITRIELDTVGDVPEIDAAAFQEHAETAKKNCPVSQALAAIDITLKARLA